MCEFFVEQVEGIGKPRRKKYPLDIFCLSFSLAPDQSETWPLLFDSSRYNLFKTSYI